MRTTVRASAAVEAATGLALLVAPSVVLGLLVGHSDVVGALVGRVLGSALLALGACGVLWDGRASDTGVPVGFVTYNVLATAVLLAAGLAGSADGALLWPAVAVHAVIGLALVAGWARATRGKPSSHSG